VFLWNSQEQIQIFQKSHHSSQPGRHRQRVLHGVYISQHDSTFRRAGYAVGARSKLEANHPNGADDDEPADNSQYYLPTHHDPATFQPTYVHDLIPVAERREHLGEKEDYEYMQNLLANHLQIMYRDGRLRWPKTRSEIAKAHNDLPRAAFPDAGDL
jgi:hypothetical protein